MTKNRIVTKHELVPCQELIAIIMIIMQCILFNYLGTRSNLSIYPRGNERLQ